MFSVNQCLLYGRTLSADKYITDAMLYHKLAGKTDEGNVPVYGEYTTEAYPLYSHTVSYLPQARVTKLGHSSFIFSKKKRGTSTIQTPTHWG